MKCQHCEKAATFHITELTGGVPEELHLCEDHARQYLTEGQQEPDALPVIAGAIVGQFAIGQTAEDLARLDPQACPVCGITFYEFRSQGRFGCPHDYIFFYSDDFERFLSSIHGDSKHTGKRPKRFAGDTDNRTALIRLRREMKDAIAEENYELASELRDRIKQTEKEVAGD